MPKKCVTLYIDDASLRVLEMRKSHIRTCAEKMLEPGLVNRLVVTDPGKLAGEISHLLKSEKIRARRFNIGISAVQCLTRQIVLPVLPRNLLAEAVIREAKRLLPVPIEQLYLSWQVINIAEGKVRVFLVAMRRVSIDSLFQALKLARIKAVDLSLKPFALARLVKGDCIIVDVQRTDFDIAICIDGVPQPVRSDAFPAGDVLWSAKVPIIMDEIDRIIKFHNANNPEKPLPSNLPLYVCGELAAHPELYVRLNERFGYPVKALTPGIEFPNGINATNFLINLTLSMAEKQSLLDAETPVTSMDVLPAEHKIESVKWSRVIAIPAATAFLGVAVPLVILIGGAMENIKSARDQLDATNIILLEKQVLKQDVKKELKQREEELAKLRAVHDACKHVLDTLTEHASVINGDFKVLIYYLSPGVEFTRVSAQNDFITIDGKATDEDTMLTYARALDESGRFVQTIVASITLEETGERAFTLILSK